jgi:transaldolase
MKLFLDTANLADIETALQKGFITGITTNPSLMAKEPKGNYIDHMKKIVKLIDQYSNPVSLSVEVFAQNKEDIITQAEELVGEIQYENLSIKVPIGGKN